MITKLDLINEEIERTDRIILTLLIERDICMIRNDVEEVGKISNEIIDFMNRKDALIQIQKLELEQSDGKGFEDFVSVVTIESNLNV